MLPNVVARAEIKAFLARAGVPAKEAHKLAEELSKRFEERGVAVESERLRWPQPPSVIWNEAQRQQIGAPSKHMIAQEISLLSLLLLTTGCRPQELYRLNRNDVHVFGSDILLIIRIGETKRASRTLSLRSLCSDWSLCDQALDRMKRHPFAISSSGGDTLWPALSREYPFRKGRRGRSRQRGKPHFPDHLDGRRVTPKLRRELGLTAKGLRLYDIRHLAILCAHCEKLASHGRKNEIYSLITASREMGHASLVTDIASYSGTGFAVAATSGRDIPSYDGAITPSHEFWRKFLVFHTLAEFDDELLENIEEAVDKLIWSVNGSAEAESPCVYRVSTAAKSDPPALMLARSLWPAIGNVQLRLELNTRLLIEIMKRGKSFAIPATLEARWKIVQAAAETFGFSLCYFGDRRPEDLSTAAPR